MTKSDKPRVNLFLLAGEASGDIIGADLIKRMRAHVNLDLSGVGGAHMIDAGMTSIFPITDLSVMGYADVIIKLPLLMWRVRQVINKILKTKPDIVVLIDSQVFSNLVTKGLKKRGFLAPVILYVCPTVWGYKPERAKKIRSLYQEVLAVLPFEPQVMAQLNGPPCRYVGHPALAQALERQPTMQANTIILMPGSRIGELRRHLPMLKGVVESLSNHDGNLTFSLLTLPHLTTEIQQLTKDWQVPIKLETDRARRQEIYAHSRFGLVVAGTATLELALAHVPMIVNYVMDMGQVRIKNSIQIKYFSLPNLVLDEALIPEFLFEKPDPDILIKAALDLLQNPNKAKVQIEGFQRMQEKLEQGTPLYRRQDPALCVLSHLQLP